MILQEEMVELDTLRGPMRTHVYRPVADGRYPGIVLWSEIYQRTGPIKRAAAFVAGHGYVVAVPEIYHEFLEAGTELTYTQEGTDTGNRLKVEKEVASFDSDARAALDFLAGSSHCTGKLGTMGICIGGHLAFRSAMHADCAAAVCFYATDIHKGSLGKGGDDSLSRIADIGGELLMIWGRQDPHIPDAGRRIVYDALVAAGTTFTWHEFNGQHAFIRDEGHRYDPELTRTCQGLVLDLFRRVLC